MADAHICFQELRPCGVGANKAHNLGEVNQSWGSVCQSLGFQSPRDGFRQPRSKPPQGVGKPFGLPISSPSSL